MESSPKAQAPKPIQWETLEESEVLEHRHLRCRHYDTCLSLAIQKRWQGFSCVECLVEVRPELLEPPTTEDDADYRCYIPRYSLFKGA
jgi:hypothetical protein